MREKGTYVEAEITVTYKGEFKLAEGETVMEFQNRYADIYLHGAGAKGHLEKTDLGGNTVIKTGAVTKVE